MKKILFTLILVITYNSYSQISSFEEKTNSYINNFLKKNNRPSDFGTTPLIVLDGKPIVKEKLSELKNLRSENIVNIYTFDKTSETGKAIWGEHAADGVLLILTNLTEDQHYPDIKDSKILFVLDNKIITKEQAYALNPSEDTQDRTIYIIGSKFLLFNNEEYDGIMVLTSKVK